MNDAPLEWFANGQFTGIGLAMHAVPAERGRWDELGSDVELTNSELALAEIVEDLGGEWTVDADLCELLAVGRRR